MEQSQRYQLGAWIVCPQTNTLTNQADIQALDNKSMQVLLFLIQHAGKHLTKNQIFEHVWNKSIVAEDILSVTVSKIRKALGDNARSPSFIKTLPGVGYVLIADVKKIDGANQTASQLNKSSRYSAGVITFLLVAFLTTSLVMYFLITDAGSSSTQLNIKSIAVLPFDDLSSKQDNQHFTDGLPDAIIDHLSQNKSLKVISRYSSFTYRGNYNATEIGQALQVETLLDGSVQKMGEQVRINVRIFSTKNGQQLWSKTFDSDNQNIFKLQDNISAAIQEIIQPNYNPGENAPSSTSANTINAQAYEWYLMGQYHWRQRNPISLAKAVTYFKQCLELEPDYAEAHVGLGITYAFLHTYGNWDEDRAIEAALPHIMKALALKPNSPTALAAKGMLLSNKGLYQEHKGQPDPALYQQAQQAFILSLELDDNATTHHWYSSLLKRLGKKSDVIQHMNRAIELNPLSGSLIRSLSFYLQSQGEEDSAHRTYQRALSLDSDAFSKVVDTAKMHRYTQESIMAMTDWHVANPALFETCSSDEYCEELAFLYLSIGENKTAQEFMIKLRPQHLHFRVWLNSIAASATEDELSVVSNIARLYDFHPTNSINLYRLAVAQFRADKFALTKSSLSQLYPDWRNKTSFLPSDITADNYLAMVLYAATLSKLDEKEEAYLLLHKVQTFLQQDRVFDKIQAEMTLAEINAQLNNAPQAIHHLATALEMGWLESYNKEWWSLPNNHLLQPLREAPEFKLLLQQHQKKLNELREKVTRKLSTRPDSIEQNLLSLQ